MKKIKLNPIDISSNMTAMKANRLLALSKSNRESPIFEMNNKLSKNYSKNIGKKLKAKNYEEAE